MKKIKFIYDTVSHDVPENRKTYRFDRIVDEDESLRDIAIDIIKTAIKSGYDENIFEENLDNKPGLQISTNKEVMGKATSSFYFGSNGEVIFLSFYESLEKDWTISELEYLYENNYLKNNTDVIYIAYPMGLGGGIFQDIVDNLASQLINSICGVAAVRGLEIGKNTIESIIGNDEIKSIAKRFVTNNNVRSARQLREFIELKESWKLEELKKRLGLDERNTMIILDSLGYELSKNNWYMSFNPEAKFKREQWHRDKEYL